MTGDKPIVKEACVETIAEALRAEKLGADRVEFCARLDLDGLTPPLEMVEQLQQQLRIPIHLMIRPRAGDFHYHEGELVEMERIAHWAAAMDLDGVVFGATKSGPAAGDVMDFRSIGRLCSAAGSMDVTIHKAIDTVADPLRAIEGLAAYEEIKYILSSGQAETALEGSSVLREMERVSRECGIGLIACGRVTDQNLPQVQAAIGARFYHGRKIVGEL